MDKPLIGLNADYRATKKDAPAFSYIARGYFDSILAAGGLPVVLPPVEDPADIAQFLDMVQGVVLVGGADLDPTHDGFMPHPSVRTVDARREAFDRALMLQIADRRKPVFGIGMGMQLLNVQMGGNLFFHIPEDLPQALPHKDPMDPNHRHGLVVEADSIMERIFGDGEVRVNSMHHMSVDEVAPGFRVTARAPDGIVEAIEYAGDDWFAMGTQFHPQADSASALDQRIVEEFIEGVGGGVSMKLVA